MSKEVIRLRPFHYLHLKDTNANIIRVKTGPGTYTCQQHEQVILGPEKMIVIPPSHYTIIENPVIRNEDSTIRLDKNGQAMLKHCDKEIRFEQQPFPLFPGEISGHIHLLQTVEENTALRLKANRDFIDGDCKREAGEVWLFYGRKTYYPRVEVDIVNTIKAVILQPDQALKIRAKKDCTDKDDNRRRGGEEWIYSVPGAYLPGVHEEILKTITAYVITNTKALHVEAKSTFIDTRRGKEILRKAGSKWLVTKKHGLETYIPDVNETVIKEVLLTVLTDNEYCFIQNPVDKNGVPDYGQKKMVKGPTSFFLKPGELLDNTAVRQAILLSAAESLRVKSTEAVEFEFNGRKRLVKPGDIFNIYGPGEFYVPQGATYKKINAFLQIEPLGLYYFQPTLFFLSVLGIAILLYYFLKSFSSV